jgi:hypothetical protein
MAGFVVVDDETRLVVEILIGREADFFKPGGRPRILPWAGRQGRE